MTNPLRRRCAMLALAGSGVLLGLVAVAVLASRAVAQGVPVERVMPVVNWLSFTGVAALIGVGIQWGAIRERMQSRGEEMARFRIDVARRFDRIEQQIDSLFELVGHERRHLDRHRYGERVDPEPEQ